MIAYIIYENLDEEFKISGKVEKHILTENQKFKHFSHPSRDSVYFRKEQYAVQSIFLSGYLVKNSQSITITL